MSRDDLLIAGLANCKICAILNAREMFSAHNMLDENFIDKEVLLCALNIKTMSFDDSTSDDVTKQNDDVVDVGSRANSARNSLVDVELIDMEEKTQSQGHQGTRNRSGAAVQLLVELGQCPLTLASF